jgi:hypothetical protein
MFIRSTARVILRCLLRIDPSNSRCLSIVPSASSRELESSMKRLTESGQYRQALDLFDQYSSNFTSIAWTQALKACAKLRDRERGIEIHRQLRGEALQDPFLQTSLLHFYSERNRVACTWKCYASIVRHFIAHTSRSSAMSECRPCRAALFGHR